MEPPSCSARFFAPCHLKFFRCKPILRSVLINFVLYTIIRGWSGCANCFHFFTLISTQIKKKLHGNDGKVKLNTIVTWSMVSTQYFPTLLGSSRGGFLVFHVVYVISYALIVKTHYRHIKVT